MKLEKGQEINGLRARIFKKTPGVGLIKAGMETGDIVVIDKWTDNNECLLAAKEGTDKLYKFLPEDLEIFSR